MSNAFCSTAKNLQTKQQTIAAALNRHPEQYQRDGKREFVITFKTSEMGALQPTGPLFTLSFLQFGIPLWHSGANLLKILL